MNVLQLAKVLTCVLALSGCERQLSADGMTSYTCVIVQVCDAGENINDPQ